MSVEFELAADVDRVVVNVQTLDEPYVIESGKHKVTDPALIVELDANPFVKRSDGSKAAGQPFLEGHHVVEAQARRQPAAASTATAKPEPKPDEAGKAK